MVARRIQEVNIGGEVPPEEELRRASHCTEANVTMPAASSTSSFSHDHSRWSVAPVARLFNSSIPAGIRRP